MVSHRARSATVGNGWNREVGTRLLVMRSLHAFERRLRRGGLILTVPRGARNAAEPTKKLRRVNCTCMTTVCLKLSAVRSLIVFFRAGEAYESLSPCTAESESPAAFSRC